MAKYLIVVLWLSCAVSFAFQPIIPEANDFNTLKIKYNFDSMYLKRFTIPNGATTLEVEFPCGTTSVVLGTLNTQGSNYLAAVETFDGTCEVSLDSAAADTLEVSLFTITGFGRE